MAEVYRKQCRGCDYKYAAPSRGADFGLCVQCYHSSYDKGPMGCLQRDRDKAFHFKGCFHKSPSAQYPGLVMCAHPAMIADMHETLIRLQRERIARNGKGD